jgi:hypothetical protein
MRRRRRKREVVTIHATMSELKEAKKSVEKKKKTGPQGKTYLDTLEA